MRFFIKVLSIVFFVALLAAMLIATEDKYSLIYEMDPSIPEGSFVDNGNGSGNEVGAAALFLILLLQFMSFYFSMEKMESDFCCACLSRSLFIRNASFIITRCCGLCSWSNCSAAVMVVSIRINAGKQSSDCEQHSHASLSINMPQYEMYQVTF